MDTINERVEQLRAIMRRESIDAFIFPSTDPHNGEYVPRHWMGREWISGFNGSAGTAVVTLHEAALWTDSRYFIAAAEQLSGTEFRLMKERLPETPSITDWLKQKLTVSGGTCVGIDGMVLAASTIDEYKKELGKSGITIRHNFDPLSVIWKDRPAIPLDKAEVHPLEFAGESVASKLSRIREKMKAERADWHLVTALDDIAWTLNLRGTDVHCNPVTVSYLLIGKDSATIFIDERKLTDSVRQYLEGNGIDISDYNGVKKALKDITETKNGVSKNATLLMDPDTTCYSLYYAAPKAIIRAQQSPIPVMKIMKNDTEIAGYRSAMKKDGVALVKFLRWLDEWKAYASGKGLQGWEDKNAEFLPLTEISLDRKLTSLRAEQEGFRDISFDTIAGYQEHGAIVHYEATPETDIELHPEGLVLLDSGAQYLDGTTDITRTLALGSITEEQRHVYTLVLKGNISLAMAKFPDGASGTQVDILARQFMWKEGMNYLHGTGHGVGSYLNVHEGPHQFRMEWKPQPLRAGMTITDEPGLYLEGKFGVRTENTMLITPYMETAFGKFLQLEPLTLCPIDTYPIDLSMMTAEEKAWLNDYHATVRNTLMPLLSDAADREWLEKATKVI